MFKIRHVCKYSSLSEIPVFGTQLEALGRLMVCNGPVMTRWDIFHPPDALSGFIFMAENM